MDTSIALMKNNLLLKINAKTSQRCWQGLIWCIGFAMLYALMPGSAHATNAQGSAQPVANIAVNVATITHQPLVLANYFAVLEDPGTRLTLADVQQPALAARFQSDPKPAQSLNFGLSKSAWWLRLQLHNPGAVSVQTMLEIAYPRITDIELHQAIYPSAALPGTALDVRQFQTTLSGNARPFSRRDYQNRSFVYPLVLPAKSNQVLYLRIQSKDLLDLPIRLFPETAFYSYERSDYAVQAIFFGMAVALIVFNLLLFFNLRDTNYLRYVFFACCLILTIAANNGLADEFLWGDSPLLCQIGALLFALLTLAALILFLRSLLETKQKAPLLDRLLQLMLAFDIVIAVLTIVAFERILLLGLLTEVLSCGLILLAAIIFALRRQRRAYFFVAAFTMAALGAVVTIMRLTGVIPSNIFTTHALQFGASILLLEMSFALLDRYNIIRREKVAAQREALAAGQLLTETMVEAERLLEQRVEQRSNELSASSAALLQANIELQNACQLAESSRQQAQLASEHASRALAVLRATQSQLIHAEKTAALGHLIAGVAHEINNPIGALKSSNDSISDALWRACSNAGILFQTLDQESLALLEMLVAHANSNSVMRTSREERAQTRAVSEQLEQAGIPQARHRAAILVHVNAQADVARYFPLLRHPGADLILDTARNAAMLISNMQNINAAIARAAKIVFTLHSFSQIEPAGEVQTLDLQVGIEAVLMLYQSQIKKDIELVRRYEPIAPLRGYPDELNQVWTNLIHNALQAMDFRGTLTLTIGRIGDEAVVGVGDTGCGIPESIIDKIFEAFFSTKVAGEGSGLGLDIVKKIVQKHHGWIDVQSEVGVGTTFLVFLPYATGGI